MKYIKYVVYIVVILITTGIIFKIIKWIEPSESQIIITTPIDTSFAPIIYRDYRPASTPFENPVKPKIILPKNIKERDIDKVIIIRKDTNPADTTALIITKDGDTYVHKDRVGSVEIVTYVPPILDCDWFVKIGVDGMPLSPFIGIGFLEIYGRVHLPIFVLDLYGIGIGADLKLYKPLHIGAMLHTDWQSNRSLKIVLSYLI